MCDHGCTGHLCGYILVYSKFVLFSKMKNKVSSYEVKNVTENSIYINF